MKRIMVIRNLRCKMNTLKTIRGPRLQLDAWIARLEKNDLPQGKGKLHNTTDPDKDRHGFCCLGILQVADPHGNGKTEANGITPSKEWLRSKGISFARVGTTRAGACFEDDITSPHLKLPSGEWTSAWNANDSRMLTFPEIASLIRNHVEYTD